MTRTALQKSLYPKEGIEAVIYRLAGKFSAQLHESGDTWFVEIHPLTGGPSSEDCAHLLRIELNDQSLRAQIALKTEHLKTLILSNAFSRTNLVPQNECAPPAA